MVLRRRADLTPTADDIFMAPEPIRKHDLKAGSWIKGRISSTKETEGHRVLIEVEHVYDPVLVPDVVDLGAMVLVKLGADLERTRAAVRSLPLSRCRSGGEHFYNLRDNRAER